MKYCYLFCLYFLVIPSSLFANKLTSSHFIQSATSYDKKIIIIHDLNINSLNILDSKNLTTLKTIPLLNKKGEYSDVSGLHDASTRNSFIVALKNSPELWEINYQIPAPAGFGTWVHDYHKESGEAKNTLFPIRHLMLKAPLDNFFFDNKHINVISVSCNGNVQIIDLDLGKRVSQFHLSEKNLVKKNLYKIKNLNQKNLSKIAKKAIQFRLKNCN